MRTGADRQFVGPGSRIGGLIAVATCCGLAMAIALGAVAVTGASVVLGLSVAVMVGCGGLLAWMLRRDASGRH